AQNDDAPVLGWVTDSGLLFISNQNRRRSHGNRVRWTNADSHVVLARGRHEANENGRFAGRQNWSADVRNRTWLNLRANMHVGHSSGWGHNRLSGSSRCRVPQLL